MATSPASRGQLRLVATFIDVDLGVEEGGSSLRRARARSLPAARSASEDRPGAGGGFVAVRVVAMLAQCFRNSVVRCEVCDRPLLGPPRRARCAGTLGGGGANAAGSSGALLGGAGAAGSADMHAYSPSSVAHSRS